MEGLYALIYRVIDRLKDSFHFEVITQPPSAKGYTSYGLWSRMGVFKIGRKNARGREIKNKNID